MLSPNPRRKPSSIAKFFFASSFSPLMTPMRTCDGGGWAFIRASLTSGRTGATYANPVVTSYLVAPCTSASNPYPSDQSYDTSISSAISSASSSKFSLSSQDGLPGNLVNGLAMTLARMVSFRVLYSAMLMAVFFSLAVTVRFYLF